MPNWWEGLYQPQWAVPLLPGNATPWERVNDAGDGEIVARTPVRLVTGARMVADCPEAWLPYLAAERSVDEYSSAWPVMARRAVIADSFGMHRVKGTRPVLDRALAPLGYTIQVREWFESNPQRPPYTFRIRVDMALNATWTAFDRNRVIRVANAAKNAHTKLELIELRRVSAPVRTYIGGLVGIRGVVTLKLLPRHEFGVVRGRTRIAGIPVIRGIVTLRSRRPVI